MAVCSNDIQNMCSFLVKNMHFNDLNPIKCGWHQRKPGGFWGPSVHPCYNLHYVLSGRGEYTVKGKTYKLEKNCLFMIKPDMIIKQQADEDNPWLYAWIAFEGSAAEELFASCGFTDDVYTMYCPEIYGVFDEFRHIPVGKEVSAVSLNAKLYTIIERLLMQNQPQTYETPVSQYCIKAADYIQANYQTHITIDGIAKNLGIDRRYFSRIFTKYFGVSPQKYLVDYRLEKAKYLLTSGEYSVSEVALSVGYDDIFAFSKIFKKKYGFSPSKCNNR
ncbi:MAG: AraC family transcriptional regulator [Clostridia bacterium]|nr:AraC family transcriptional regulator [Oscillospiraceae bacterium]MBQ6702735.1 AraC family transcriptional regulator [Clostridia bacterium]